MFHCHVENLLKKGIISTYYVLTMVVNIYLSLRSRFRQTKDLDTLWSLGGFQVVIPFLVEVIFKMVHAQ